LPLFSFVDLLKPIPPLYRAEFVKEKWNIFSNFMTFLLFLMGKKSNKRTQPVRCGKLPDLMISVAWAKTR